MSHGPWTRGSLAAPTRGRRGSLAAPTRSARGACPSTRSSTSRLGHVTPMSVRRAEGESFAPLSYCLFTPLLIADPGRAPFTHPLQPQSRSHRAPHYDARLDAAGPCSPACGPTGVLSSGTESWRPGLDAPLIRSRTAAKREAGAPKASRGAARHGPASRSGRGRPRARNRARGREEGRRGGGEDTVGHWHT